MALWTSIAVIALVQIGMLGYLIWLTRRQEPTQTVYRYRETTTTTLPQEYDDPWSAALEGKPERKETV